MAIILLAGSLGCGSTPTAPIDSAATIDNTLRLVSVSLQGAESLGLGESSRYRLWGSMSPNGVVDESGSAAWLSLTPALLKMDKGVATGLAPGPAKIQTTLVTPDGTFVTTKDVQVLTTPPTPPSSLTIAGTFCASLYILGQPCSLQLLTNATVNVSEFASWTISDPLVASVSSGFVTPRKVGSTDLTATYLGVSAAFRVTVFAPVKITVTAPFPTMYVGQKVSLNATAQFTDGAERVVSDVASWTTSNPAALSATGGASAAMSGLAPGSADVVATYGNVSGSLGVRVIPAAVDTLVLSSPSTDQWAGTLQPGGFGALGMTVNYVLASAATGKITLYVRNQNGVDLSIGALVAPRTADVSSGEGFKSLFTGFSIPAGTTMLCPSVVMRPSNGADETVVTALCRSVGS